jgi:predicted Zn-dependent peptidase
LNTNHRDLLPNGLRVVTLEVPHLHSAMLAVYVRVGSRHETAQNNGVSHFLEHMFFRGSKRYPDTTVMNGLIEDAGGSLNGITMRDQSLYYTPIHPQYLRVGFEVLGDILSAPTLQSLDVEREIILEEMMDEVDVQGRDIDVGNLSKMLVYGDHPLSLKIAGTPKTVHAMTEEMLVEHHRRFYTASNMVLAAAGPVKREAVLEEAARCFGSFETGARVNEEPPKLESGKGPHFLFVAHDESQTELQLSFPCVPESHPDHLPLNLIRAILDDGLTSWLPLNVVERRGLAYSVRAGIDLFDDTAVFELEAACTPAKVVPVVEEMTQQLARLCEEPLSQEELDRVRSRQRIGLDFTRDDLNALAGWYGATELFRQPETFEERLVKLEAITPRQIQEAARRTFTRDNLYLCAVGPAKGRAESKLAKAAREAPL